MTTATRAAGPRTRSDGVEGRPGTAGDQSEGGASRERDEQADAGGERAASEGGDVTESTHEADEARGASGDVERERPIDEEGDVERGGDALTRSSVVATR